MKILKFYADWCMPCRAMTPIFNQVSTMPNFTDIKFEEVNVDDKFNRELVIKCKVRSIPFIVAIDENENIIKTLVGVVSKEELINFVNSVKNG